MYFIRKYSDCWAIHNDDTEASRQLTKEEVQAIKGEFPTLAEDKVRSVFTDTITSIQTNLPPNRA